MTIQQKLRMEQLVNILNEACRAYYSDTDEESTISDKIYDELLSELITLENETGEKLPHSPTIRVGYSDCGQKKMEHVRPILSLKDTKDVDELLRFLGKEEGVLSWKLDGVSLVLHYVDGELVNALTRGDGLIGRCVTESALRMRNIPSKIPSTNEELFVRGEGCISINDFEQIKRTKDGERFSNPRNLAAGIINTTKAPNTLLRHTHFVAHSIVKSDGKASYIHTRIGQLAYLDQLGFKVVPHTKVLNFQLKNEIAIYTQSVADYEYPVDGLVLTLNDVRRGEDLGCTAKYPKHSMAFKWPDEHKLSKVRTVKWSVSKTGLITPVVIFDPIELEGTTVHQANLHNLKFFEDLQIGFGDILKVYKANKIIPEVEENLTRSGTEKYPETCPCCRSKTVVVDTGRTRKLYCSVCGEKQLAEKTDTIMK